MSNERIDVSKDRTTDWEKVVASGELVRKTSLVREDVNTPGVMHVQGREILPGDAYVGPNGQPTGERIKPVSVMQHVMQTGRYPDPPKGTSTFVGNWPVFGPDGKIIG